MNVLHRELMALNLATKNKPANQPLPASVPTPQRKPVFGKKGIPQTQEKQAPAQAEKKEYPKVNENQIFRVDGKNCFLEVTKGGFHLKRSNDIGNVHLSVNCYDAVSHKMKTSIALYVDFDKWMQLTDLIESQAYLELMRLSRDNQLQGNYQYASHFWIDNGRLYENGVLYARLLKLIIGSKKDKHGNYLPIEEQPIIVKGEIVPGRESETKLVQPIPGAKTVRYVQVPVPQNEFKAMIKLVNMQIQAYYTAEATTNALKEALYRIYEKSCNNNKLLIGLQQFVDGQD